MSAMMLNLNIVVLALTGVSENLPVTCLTEHGAFGIKQLKNLIMYSFQVNKTKVEEYPGAFVFWSIK